MKRHVTKEDTEVANKRMKGGSTSLAIKEIQSKNTMRYLCMPVRKLKTLKTPNANKDTEKPYLWHTAVGLQSGIATLEKCAVPYKTKHEMAQPLLSGAVIPKE